jgi:hypothetical protein
MWLGPEGILGLVIQAWVRLLPSKSALGGRRKMKRLLSYIPTLGLY